MRAALACLLIAATAAPARAEFVMCIGGQGTAPADGSVVPPRAHLAFYTDRNLGLPDKVTATIGGAAVKVSKSKLSSPPFNILIVVIESDRTGELKLTYEGHSPITYTVKPIAMPKEITGVIGRYTGPSHSGERGEEFDGLAIRLPEGTPAIIGHVKHRAAETAPWIPVDVALYTAQSETRPMIRVGQFACEANASPAVLAQGFDLEVSVTLLDGTTRPVTGLAKRMTLPASLPPQPRPKNQRER